MDQSRDNIDLRYQEAAQQWACVIKDLPVHYRYSMLEEIIIGYRPEGVHINHWRYDVHSRLVDNFVDWRSIHYQPYDHAVVLAYYTTFLEVLRGAVRPQLVRPRSYRFSGDKGLLDVTWINE